MTLINTEHMMHAYPHIKNKKMTVCIVPVSYGHPRPKWPITKDNCLPQNWGGVKLLSPNRVPSGIF